MIPRLHILLLAVCLLLGGAVRAHDTGFSHSSRTIHVSTAPDSYIIEYRIRLEPDLALIEMAGMDVNGDGEVSAVERDRWLAGRGEALLQGLNLDGGDYELAADVEGWALGAALTQTYTFRVRCAAPSLRIDDRNFQSRAGHLRVLHSPNLSVTQPDEAARFHIDRVVLVFTRQPAPAAE